MNAAIESGAPQLEMRTLNFRIACYTSRFSFLPISVIQRGARGDLVKRSLHFCFYACMSVFCANAQSTKTIIPIRVSFHPDILSTWKGDSGPNGFVKAIVQRANEMFATLCNGHDCNVRIEWKDKAEYRYTMSWRLAESEDVNATLTAAFELYDTNPSPAGAAQGAVPLGMRAKSAAPLILPSNVRTIKDSPRTVYVVRTIESCRTTDPIPDKTHIEGCTRLGSPNVALAIGPSGYDVTNKEWITGIAFGLIHELGHTVGLLDVAPVKLSDPHTTPFPIMGGIHSAGDLRGQMFLTPDEAKRFAIGARPSAPASRTK